VADIDADRQQFRANAARETIYPEGIAETVIEGSQDARWGLFLAWGSTARGDSTDISDIDIYAEPLGPEVDRAWVLHFRDRMQAYNVDLLIPGDGSSLAERLAAGDEFAKQMLREALVLSDHANVIDGLRDRYLH
jgi:predicted nucleotidyltransferase